VRTANSTADALMAGRPAGRDRGVELSHSSGIAAALFDRDGTLVEDVPCNGDPAMVRPAPGARAVLVPTAVTRAEEVATAPVVAGDLGVA